MKKKHNRKAPWALLAVFGSLLVGVVLLGIKDPASPMQVIEKPVDNATFSAQ